jgi:hypothetical protein
MHMQIGLLARWFEKTERPPFREKQNQEEKKGD